MIRLAWMLLLPLSAVAAATDDDEARIEVLIQAERGNAGADSETARPPTTSIAPAIHSAAITKSMATLDSISNIA